MEKWQLDALNFEVKAIETFLGFKFDGETVEQKQVFVAAHRDTHIEVTTELLRQAYENHIKNPAQDMKIYAMNENNHVLHYSWNEALAYYTMLVGQDNFDAQKDCSTGDEIDPSEFTVVIENEEKKIRGTVKELIEIGEITGEEYYAIPHPTFSKI